MLLRIEGRQLRLRSRQLVEQIGQNVLNIDRVLADLAGVADGRRATRSDLLRDGSDDAYANTAGGCSVADRDVEIGAKVN